MIIHHWRGCLVYVGAHCAQGLVVGSGIQNFEGRREYEGTCLYKISLEGQKSSLKTWRDEGFLPAFG